MPITGMLVRFVDFFFVVEQGWLVGKKNCSPEQGDAGDCGAEATRGNCSRYQCLFSLLTKF